MKWKNIPIPETIVIPLAIGLIIDYFFSSPALSLNGLLLILGILFFILGLTLMIWSVREAGLLDMADPNSLITSGPYSFSRNPMYLSWILIYISITFLLRSVWLFILFFIAILVTHYMAVLPEEQKLKERFGERFINYCSKVRRYI